MPAPGSAARRTRSRIAAAAAAFAASGALATLAACGDAPATAPEPDARTATAAAEGGGTPTPIRLPLRIAPDLVVSKAEFGVLETDAEGEERFVPKTELPALEGTTFGWVLHVQTQRDSIHWQEHLRLPKAPADWGDAADDPDLLISRDGRSVAAHGEDAPADGELTRFYWTLSTGDPAGDYELDVAIEGRTVAQFRFRVPAPVQEQAILVSNPRTIQRPRGGAARVADAAATPEQGAT